jgi:hypothetical protein
MLAINNRVATSTGLSPFFVTHGYNIDLLSLTREEENLRTTKKSPIARGEAFIARLKEATEFAQAAMAAAQERQEEYANRARRAAEQFRVGDKVWVSLRNVKTDRPSRKLDWLNAKYTVTKLIGSHACRLDTPPGIHNVFHVSLLRRAGDDPLPSQAQDETQPPAVVAAHTNEEEWGVEEILEAKETRRGTKVLVKWTGYVKPTWEPLSAFLETEALDRFETVHGKITP